MTRLILGLLVGTVVGVLFVMLVASCAKADESQVAIATFPQTSIQRERTQLANTLLVEQTADLITSQVIFSHGGYERNPFAPKNLIGEIAEVGVVQALARNPHTSIRLLRGAVLVYPIVLGNNVHVILNWRH